MTEQDRKEVKQIIVEVTTKISELISAVECRNSDNLIIVRQEGDLLVNRKLSTIALVDFIKDKILGEGASLYGVADASGTPQLPQAGKGFWFALEPGTYTNYGGIVVEDTPQIIYYDSLTGEWTSEDFDLGANAVLYVPQSLTDAQKLQARKNIDTRPTASTIPSGGMKPNVLYDLGTVTGSKTFTCAAAQSGEYAHYYFIFQTGNTVPTITWPSILTAWGNSQVPLIEANKKYEVSILNGVGLFIESSL